MKQAIVRCIRRLYSWRQVGSTLGLALLIVTVVYGRIIQSEARTSIHLVVYAFSTQEEVLTQSIFPTFERIWEAETGRELTIEGVFGPSGTLAGQINLGAPADVALFSNAQHVTYLKVGRRVREDNQPVVIGHTPMVIVTRPGNPAGITGFSDLAQPGLRLLHADPSCSGAGQWAVLAEYGSSFLQSHDRAAAQAQLEAIWGNVRLLGSSARATLTLFELGAGDAMITYEQDARLARERGIALEIVVPPHTIIAQHVAVVVDDNVTSAERPVVEAFVQYLSSDAGQQILERYHLRPVTLEGDLFPTLVHPFTVEDLGGWSDAYAELVEAVWKTNIAPRLDLEPTPRILGTGEQP